MILHGSKNHAEKPKGRGSGDVRPILEQGNRQILQIVCRSKKEQCKRKIVEIGGISSCVKL